MTDRTPAWPLPPVTCPFGEGSRFEGEVWSGGKDRRKGVEIVSPSRGGGCESSAMARSALHTQGRQQGADSAASPPTHTPQRSSPLKLGVRGGSSGSGEWRFLGDLGMSFPPGAAANSGLAHRPPEGTSCVLGHPHPTPIQHSIPMG